MPDGYDYLKCLLTEPVTVTNVAATLASKLAATAFETTTTSITLENMDDTAILYWKFVPAGEAAPTVVTEMLVIPPLTGRLLPYNKADLERIYVLSSAASQLAGVVQSGRRAKN